MTTCINFWKGPTVIATIWSHGTFFIFVLNIKGQRKTTTFIIARIHENESTGSVKTPNLQLQKIESLQNLLVERCRFPKADRQWFSHVSARRTRLGRGQSDCWALVRDPVAEDVRFSRVSGPRCCWPQRRDLRSAV